MSFVGGKLKLKGGDVPGVSKKKKKKVVAGAVVAVNNPEQGKEEVKNDTKEILEGRVLPQPAEDADRRTEAERKYEERFLEAEARRLAKLAGTSHRDRINEFNEKLATLSEHHDIPKVGPG